MTLTRFTQLLAKILVPIFAIIAAKLGVAEGETDGLLAAGAALAALIGDLIFHKAKTGSVFSDPGERTPAKARTGRLPMVFITLCLIAAPLVAAGCTQRQLLPQDQAQRANEQGPQHAINVQGMAIFHVYPGAAPPKFCDTVRIEQNEGENSVAATIQGDSDQEGTQTGGTAAPQEQSPKVEPEIDVSGLPSP